jgi:hypothetical protein
MAEFVFGYIFGAITVAGIASWVTCSAVGRARKEGTARLSGILTVADRRGGYRPVRLADRDVIVPPRGPSPVLRIRRVK